MELKLIDSTGEVRVDRVKGDASEDQQLIKASDLLQCGLDEMLENTQVLDATLPSLQIALTSAMLATIFGSLAGIVQSRLAAMDLSLEEAAMDLGSRPFRVMLDITLPLLIISKVKLRVTPDINALATLIILFVSVVLAWMATRRAHRKTG